MQLYGVDPETMRRAVRNDRGRGPGRPHRHELRLPDAEGDPAGRCAALPFKRRLFGDIVSAAVRAAEPAGIR